METFTLIFSRLSFYQKILKIKLQITLIEVKLLMKSTEMKNDFLMENFSPDTTGVITRERYRKALEDCVHSLKSSLMSYELELKAEDLRMASRALGRIVGKIETEELLDVVFRDFCIGK